MPRPALMLPRLVLDSRRRFFEPRVGLVGRLFLDLGGALDQLHQALQRIGAVLLLGAILLGLEHQHAFAGDPAVAQRQQTLLVELWQRRGRNIKPQVHRTRHFIDVLPTGTLGTNGGQLDLGIGQVYVVGNHQHGKRKPC